MKDDTTGEMDIDLEVKLSMVFACVSARALPYRLEIPVLSQIPGLFIAEQDDEEVIFDARHAFPQNYLKGMSHEQRTEFLDRIIEAEETARERAMQRYMNTYQDDTDTVRAAIEHAVLPVLAADRAALESLFQSDSGNDSTKGDMDKLLSIPRSALLKRLESVARRPASGEAEAERKGQDCRKLEGVCRWLDPEYPQALISYFAPELMLLDRYAPESAELARLSIRDYAERRDSITAENDGKTSVGIPPQNFVLPVSLGSKRMFDHTKSLDNAPVASQRQERYIGSRYDNAPRMDLKTGADIALTPEMRKIGGVANSFFSEGNKGVPKGMFRPVTVTARQIAEHMGTGKTKAIPEEYIQHIDDLLLLMTFSWGQFTEYHAGKPTPNPIVGHVLNADIVPVQLPNSSRTVRGYRMYRPALGAEISGQQVEIVSMGAMKLPGVRHSSGVDALQMALLDKVHEANHSGGKKGKHAIEISYKNLLYPTYGVPEAGQATRRVITRAREAARKAALTFLQNLQDEGKISHFCENKGGRGGAFKSITIYPI